MELLIWHEALGCDDEQATEQELLARVLYSYSTSGASAGSGSADDSTPAAAAEATKSDLACLHSLHFVQGLLTFVRMLKRSNDTHGDNGGAADDAESTAETHRPKKKRSEWMSATLSKRKFYIQEVESQVFIALVRNICFTLHLSDAELLCVFECCCLPYTLLVLCFVSVAECCGYKINAGDPSSHRSRKKKLDTVSPLAGCPHMY